MEVHATKESSKELIKMETKWFSRDLEITSNTIDMVNIM